MKRKIWLNMDIQQLIISMLSGFIIGLSLASWGNTGHKLATDVLIITSAIGLFIVNIWR